MYNDDDDTPLDSLVLCSTYCATKSPKISCFSFKANIMSPSFPLFYVRKVSLLFFPGSDGGKK